MKQDVTLITASGTIESSLSKVGKSGKPYFTMTIDGINYSHFDPELAKLPKGTTLEFRYCVNGVYNNLSDWEILKKPTEEVVSNSPKPTMLPTKSTWEDKNELDRVKFEFEKSKQPLIIRQSCLDRAVQLYCHLFRDDETEEVNIPERQKLICEMAQVFDDWVWEGMDKGEPKQ